jgi:hypothetical protein
LTQGARLLDKGHDPIMTLLTLPRLTLNQSAKRGKLPVELVGGSLERDKRGECSV